MSTITERVAAGAAFLDHHDPEWWRADVGRAIDLDELDLESSHSCILGQRCPVDALFVAPDWAQSRFAAMALKFGPFCDGSDINEWAAPLGFQVEQVSSGDDDADSDAQDIEYKLLTAEWTRVITNRRSAA